MGIEPMLVPHLGNTDYKSVGASSYTNPAYKVWGGRDSNPQPIDYEPTALTIELPPLKC
jgi:hypothetical protein